MCWRDECLFTEEINTVAGEELHLYNDFENILNIIIGT